VRLPRSEDSAVNHANLKKHQELNIAKPHSGKASLSHANHEGERITR
jgi:hypothetical protein